MCERDRESERERERDHERWRVCVCLSERERDRETKNSYHCEFSMLSAHSTSEKFGIGLEKVMISLPSWV